MRPRIFQSIPLLIALLGTLLLSSCVIRRGPSVWIENGQPRGRITYVTTLQGVTYRYTDHTGILRRMEMRDVNEMLLPGSCTVQYEYDATLRLIEERVLNAQNQMVPNEDGFARKTYAYSYDARGNKVSDQCLYDTQGRPVRGRDGFARAKIVFAGAGNEAAEVFLYDENQRATAGVWDTVAGTVHIKYMTVEGIGPVRYGVYYDASGNVISRKRLSGSLGSYTQVTTHNFGPPPPR